jgi:hypothetical protein
MVDLAGVVGMIGVVPARQARIRRIGTGQPATD